MQKAPKNLIHGWINLHKPVGMGSTQAVGAVKRLLRPTKIGHAGTLDPLAHGVLPLALGDATKTVPYLQDARKIYGFTVQWGQATSTADSEGEVIATHDHRPTLAEILAVLPRFIGEITQTPPAYSAIKINGKRAYDLARAGQVVAMPTRQVQIHALTCEDTCPNQGWARFRVECSKGTYVRSLATDLAQSLGTVGHVTSLERAAVGGFCLSHAISLDFIGERVHKAASLGLKHALGEWLLPLSAALDDIPALKVEANAAKALRHGQTISDADNHQAEGEWAAYCNGALVAIVTRQGGIIVPKRVFSQVPEL
jgi:tRNA pseudouridine55 synthase